MVFSFPDFTQSYGYCGAVTYTYTVTSSSSADPTTIITFSNPRTFKFFTVDFYSTGSYIIKVIGDLPSAAGATT
jgi:hypothetical protein